MMYYFLFGEEVVGCYEEKENFQEVIDKIKEGYCDWQIFSYNSKDNHPGNLVNESMGWTEWAEITKDEYDQLLSTYADQRAAQ